MAASDASAYPTKNTAWRVTFPIFDADGDLVTGAASLDSEISKDGGTFADCTNEATEIATSSGMYFLDLTSTEMNADTVAIIVKTGTAGAKTTAIVAYPITLSSVRLGVNVVNAAGTAWGSGAITAAALAADAITAAKLAADVTTELQSGLATAAALSAIDGKIDTIDNFLDTEIAAILADTNELQTDWADGGRLDLILDARASQTSVDDVPTNAELSTALAAADDAVLAAIAALNNLSAAQVNAEVVDALATDTYAEPGQGAPAATATIAAKIGYLYKAWRNKKEQTATTHSLYADDGTTVDQKSTVSDDGTTATRGEVVTGP